MGCFLLFSFFLFLSLFCAFMTVFLCFLSLEQLCVGSCVVGFSVMFLCFFVLIFYFCFKYGSIRKMQTILDGKLFSKKFLSVCFFQRLLLHFFFKDYFCTFLTFLF